MRRRGEEKLEEGGEWWERDKETVGAGLRQRLWTTGLSLAPVFQTPGA